MDDMLSREVLETFEHPEDNIRHCPLRQRSILGDQGFHVALVAVLCDDVAVVGAEEHFVALQDVGVSYGFKDLYFRIEKLPQDGRFDLVELHDLDGDHLLGPLLDALVDRGKGAPPENIVKIEIVVLHLLGDVPAGRRGAEPLVPPHLRSALQPPVDLH